MEKYVQNVCVFTHLTHDFLEERCKMYLTTRQLTRLSLQAANYLDIKGLLDVTCKTVANMIKGKSPEEIRKTFNIKNDFTPQEEEQVGPVSQHINLGLIVYTMVLSYKTNLFDLTGSLYFVH